MTRQPPKGFEPRRETNETPETDSPTGGRSGSGKEQGQQMIAASKYAEQHSRTLPDSKCIAMIKAQLERRNKVQELQAFMRNGVHVHMFRTDMSQISMTDWVNQKMDYYKQQGCTDDNVIFNHIWSNELNDVQKQQYYNERQQLQAYQQQQLYRQPQAHQELAWPQQPQANPGLLQTHQELMNRQGPAYEAMKETVGKFKAKYQLGALSAFDTQPGPSTHRAGDTQQVPTSRVGTLQDIVRWQREADADIDRKIQALNYEEIQKVCTRMTRYIADNKLKFSKETKEIVQAIKDDFNTLRVQIGYSREKETYGAYYDREKAKAKDAYNNLKDKYDSGTLNDTVKKWYNQVGFPFAQDNQPGPSSLMRETTSHDSDRPQASTSQADASQNMDRMRILGQSEFDFAQDNQLGPSSLTRETIDTIDSKIDALNYDALYSTHTATTNYRNKKYEGRETYQHAHAMHNDIKIIMDYYTSNKRNDTERDKALKSYESLQTKYYKGINNRTVKEWYTRICFDYAQDTQQS